MLSKWTLDNISRKLMWNKQYELLTRLAQFSPAQHFFQQSFIPMNDCYSTSSKPGILKRWKIWLASVRQPNSLSLGQLSVTPKKLIPFEVIKSIPINDILFNYLTLRGPDLTLPRNKLWSKARRLKFLYFIEVIHRFLQQIDQWVKWTKDVKKT